MLKLYMALVAVLAFAGGARAADLAAYGRLPLIQSVAISPDGGSIAYIATGPDKRFIVAQTLDGKVRATASLGDNKIRGVSWADKDHVVVETSVTRVIEGVTLMGEQFQAVILNAVTGNAVQIPTRVQEDVLNVIFGEPRPGTYEGRAVVFVELYATVPNNIQEDSQHLDLYAIDLDTGIAHKVQQGDSATTAYLVNPDGSIIAKTSYRDRYGTTTWTLSARGNGGWDDIYKVTAPIDQPDLEGVTLDHKSLIISTLDPATKLWRPTMIDIATGKLGGYVGGDGVVGVLTDQMGQVIGYRHTETFAEYDFVEPHLQAAWPVIRKGVGDRQVKMVSHTPDYSKLVLQIQGSGIADDYFVFDTAAKTLDRIGQPYPGITPDAINEVRAVRYAAADGLEITGYLTLPNSKTPKDLPLVVFAHGGPSSRDEAGFDWWAQAVASRGYAVLQANFRGSGGFGQSFIEAGYGEWGGKMQTDLSDGVRFLSAKGIVDPKRVCIVGGSYGGYAALTGITLDHGVYRCAVSVAGISDLSRMLSWEIQRQTRESVTVRYWMRFMGVTSEHDPKLDARSAALHAKDVDGPVMLIHGKDDTVVDYNQSLEMVHALEAAGKPVEMVTLKHEDHWLSQNDTRLQMLTASVAFLEKNNPPN